MPSKTSLAPIDGAVGGLEKSVEFDRERVARCFGGDVQ